MPKYELISVIFTITFVLSLLVSALSIPIVNKIGRIYSIIDYPNKRKIHKSPLVRIGGVGIFLGYFIVYLIMYLGIKNFEFLNFNKPLTLILLSSTLFFLIGICDDLYKLNPFIKLFFQITVATFLYLAGVNFEGLNFYPLTNETFLIIIPKLFSYLITIFLIVGLTNGFNWLDGLDGLASGISFILCISLGIIFLNFGQFNFALLACSLAGSTVGFLRYNVYPAKILMGDCGSYLLGATLSTLSIYGLKESKFNFILQNNNVDNVHYLPILMLFLLFLIPIVDMTQVIICRIKDGKSPFYPDRRHLHHRLLSSGINERNTVIILFTFTQLACCFTLFIFDVKGKIIFSCVSLIFLFFAIIYCIKIKSKIDASYRRK